MISKLAIVYVLTAIVAYLFGSINFSIIITRAYLKKDIREFGSGNAGTTNVLRSVGPLASALTFLGDFVKAVAAVGAAILLYKAFGIDMPYNDQYLEIGKGIGALFVMTGHVWPIYYGFKGGKGVVTGAAIALMINPIAFAVCIGTFIICILLSKIVSLSSCIATATFPITMFIIRFLEYRQSSTPVVFLVITTVLSVMYVSLIIGKHSENIKRLIAGTESKITVKKKEA